jgi:Autotransporter beta-domain
VRMTLLRAGLAFASLLIVGNPVSAFAQSCTASGTLTYLGVVRDVPRSVWLSETDQGSFDLVSAQNQQTVDSWDVPSSPGLHFSLSPVVAHGHNGGTHRLFEMSGGVPCLLDTQNQVGGFDLPSFIAPPHIPPIEDLFPELIEPPIGMLPPSGMTPEIPGVPPPIGMPPPGGVTPGARGVRQPPTATQPEEQGAARSRLDCIDPRSEIVRDGKPQKPICPPEVLAEAAAQGNAVPLTEGRELGPPKLWNAWVEPLFVQISDKRYGLDMDTELGGVTFGMDRRLGENVALGVELSALNSQTDGFHDVLQFDDSGFSVGPYLAFRLSPQWAIETSLTYGQYDNDVRLSVLEGSYQSRQWSGNVAAHGQYIFGETLVRPKASVTYSHIESDDYNLQGNLLSLPVGISFPEHSFNYGVIDASTEFSRVFNFSGGTSVMPFAEIGAAYEFGRSNEGGILKADLALATPSPWAGTLRAGVRTLLNNSVQVEASGGYLSFGQSGLDGQAPGLIRLLNATVNGVPATIGRSNFVV